MALGDVNYGLIYVIFFSQDDVTYPHVPPLPMRCPSAIHTRPRACTGHVLPTPLICSSTHDTYLLPIPAHAPSTPAHAHVPPTPTLCSSPPMPTMPMRYPCPTYTHAPPSRPHASHCSESHKLPHSTFTASLGGT